MACTPSWKNLRQATSSKTWLVEKERLSPTEFFIMPQVYVVQDSTGSNREAVSSPWWTHLDYQPFSSSTVQQICSGQNSHVSSALKILTPHPLESMLSMTTLLLQTGSSTTECRISWKSFTKGSSKLLTTGCGSNGSTEAVHRSMGLLGSLMPLMLSSF